MIAVKIRRKKGEKRKKQQDYPSAVSQYHRDLAVLIGMEAASCSWLPSSTAQHKQPRQKTSTAARGEKNLTGATSGIVLPPRHSSAASSSACRSSAACGRHAARGSAWAFAASALPGAWPVAAAPGA
uniref:Uncharacterized protein n=1 Tax=Setaria italica TaxID=4555 RepID=K3Y004_SETIT